MAAKKKFSAKIVKMIDEALEAIIDQWYLSVSDYYVTAEKKKENPAIEAPEELKRFHDELGHRIKFDKGELDFTYGLSVEAGPEGCRLQASVNTKVPNFDTPSSSGAFRSITKPHARSRSRGSRRRRKSAIATFSSYPRISRRAWRSSRGREKPISYG